MNKKNKGFPKQFIYGVMLGLLALSMGCDNKKPQMKNDQPVEQSEDMGDDASMTPKESMGAMYDDDMMNPDEASKMNQDNDLQMDQNQDGDLDEEDAAAAVKKNQQKRPDKSYNSSGKPNNGSY